MFLAIILVVGGCILLGRACDAAKEDPKNRGNLLAVILLLMLLGGC